MLNHADILIVDDHEAIRRGIRLLLESHPQWHVCGEAVDGVDAVEKVKTLHPDVVLMDISMPRMDGISAMRIVQHVSPDSRVIIVTQNDAASLRKESVRADGYVLKVHLHRDLVPVIESVLGTPHNGETPEAVPGSGSPVDPSMTVSPVKDETGRVIGASNHSHDITGSRRDERGAALLASIVNSSEDAIVSKTLEGTVTTWNPGAERLFGYRAAEMMGQPITRIIPPERHDEERDILARVQRGERVDHFETVRRRKDGSQIDVSVTISPLLDSKGRIIGASKIARDITVRKQMERALVASEQRLRMLAEELESTVHRRTRELERRNAEILEQAEQLQELSRRLQQGQDDERRRIARELHDSAGQLLAVLGLNLAQLQARVTDPDAVSAIKHSEEIVDQLNSEIRTLSYLLHPPLLDESGLTGAIQWYARGLEERGGFEIALDMPDGFRRLPQSMEVALFRIVQECLTNIHRHSGSKTAAIRLQCTDDGRVRLEVQDEGRGIPAETLAHLHRHRTGVGIAGIRERVRYFGGELNIDSGPGGTTVSVVLPIPHHVECDDGEQHPS